MKTRHIIVGHPSTHLHRSGYGVVGTVLEIMAEQRPEETRGELVARFFEEKFPAPQPRERSAVPTIEPLLPPKSHPTYPAVEPKRIFKADTYIDRWREIFTPSFCTLGAAEALANLFMPDEFVTLTAPFGDVCEFFQDLRDRIGTYEKLLPNPVLGKRFPQAPAMRSNVIVVFPGVSLKTQFTRALFLATRHFPVQLVVYCPSELTAHFWYSARNRSTEALSAFAREAIQLGADPETFSMNFKARLPGSVDRAAAIGAQQQLAEVGIEDNGSRCIVLFKQLTGDAPPTRGDDVQPPKAPEAPATPEPVAPQAAKRKEKAPILESAISKRRYERLNA